MTALIDRLRGGPSAATRMALMNAVRGTVAIMVPLLALQFLGQPAGAVMAAIGGMNTAMSDAGGAYRRRVLVMLLVAVLGAFSLFLGCQMHGIGWLAAVVLFAIAFTAGMARVFGQPGISLGLDASIAFLVGALAPQGLDSGLQFAGYYVLGSLWTVLFTLLLWRMRPYRRLFHQVAACYEACADLVAALAEGDSRSARHRLRVRHHQLREAIRQAEDTLESARLGAGHSNPVFDRSVELLHAVSREGAAAVNLRLAAPAADGTPAAELWWAALASWQAALRATVAALLTGKGQVPVTEVRTRFEALLQPGSMPSAVRPPLQLARVHLETAADAAARLVGARVPFRDWLPRIGRRGLRYMVTAVTSQLNFRSFIFRHGLRVAVAAAAAQWLADELSLTHRLWMPMTVILVLQPEFGATWRRMLQRVGGTLAGVLIAGILHFLLHGSAAESVLIAVCAFGTFLFIRRHYGVGVTMLTPMILLLLGVLVPRSGELIVARATDTLLGAALALAAAYLLWPAWQKGALGPQCRAALAANRAYLAAVLRAARERRIVHPDILQARHRAERETDNAEAVFQRMLSEPGHTRSAMRPALTFTTYLRRLTEHVLGLALALDGRTLPESGEVLGRALLARLDAATGALAGGAPPPAEAALSDALAKAGNAAPELAPWFERLASDVTALCGSAAKL